MIATWTELFLGGWLIVSPWILGVGGNTLALWNSVGVGLVLLLLGLWHLFGRGGDETFGGEENSGDK